MKWRRIYNAVLVFLLVSALLVDLGILIRLGFQAKALFENSQEIEVGTELSAPTLPELTWMAQPCSDEAIDALLSQMSQWDKVCQLFIVAPEQLAGSGSPITTADETLLQALEQYPVGGIVFFKENLIDPAQTKALLAGMQSVSPLGLFLSVDEEGGTVSRLASNPAMGLVKFDDMCKIGASGNPGLAYQAGYTIGLGIKQLGFNLDFAPVADTYSNPQNQVVAARSFSSDPGVVAQMVSASVRGFQNSGLLCTLKHFPGHGSTTEDSHAGIAVLDKSLDELEQCDFLPFRAGIATGVPMVMVGHITCPQIDPSSLPASLSYRMVTEILRGQLGFEGLVATDALQMASISSVYSSDYAAVEAFCAGCDLLVMPQNFQTSADALMEAVSSGRITQQRLDESVRRILKAKIQYGILTV